MTEEGADPATPWVSDAGVEPHAGPAFALKLWSYQFSADESDRRMFDLLSKLDLSAAEAALLMTKLKDPPPLTVEPKDLGGRPQFEAQRADLLDRIRGWFGREPEGSELSQFEKFCPGEPTMVQSTLDGRVKDLRKLQLKQQRQRLAQVQSRHEGQVRKMRDNGRGL